MKQEAWATETAVRELIDGTECRVDMIPEGPALVRGAKAVLDQEGVSRPATRPVVAVCTCARTQRSPWCDGTHKVIARKPPQDPATPPQDQEPRSE